MPSKVLRVPVVAAYNTRVSAINTSPSASGYVGIGVVGIMIIGSTASSSTKDARLVNCFGVTDSDPTTGKKTLYCVKRPGWATTTTPAAGSIGNAISVWSSQGTGQKIMTAFGATNSTVYDGVTSKGAITGLATAITETMISTTPTLAITSSDSTGWYYDNAVTVSVATKISDGDFPGNAGFTLAGTFAHIDGYACVMDTVGNLWASDLNSVTSWTANSYTNASGYPDGGVGCVRYKQYVVAFGTGSTQFFYNAGQTPFPLACSTAMTVKVGAISAAAITTMSDSIWWIGSTPQGGLSGFKYDGAGVNRFTTPEIDTILLTAGASKLSLTPIRFYGRSFILIITTGRTLAYCIEESSWHEWVGAATLWSHCAANSSGASLVNYCVSDVLTAGKVYVMNQAASVFQDDGQTYAAVPQLALMDLGTGRRKTWESLEVIGDQELTASDMTIAYTDDDYQTTQTWGTVDMTQDQRLATRLGSSRRRGWILSHGANSPMRIEALEIRAAIGSS